MSVMRGERLAEGVDLWEGDAAAVLPLLPDASVDLVLTDPPYSERTHKGSLFEGSTT